MELRVGIVGAGRIVELGHLPGFQKTSARAVSICARTPGRREELAARFGIESVHSDWSEMLATTGLDAVSICTPPNLHAEIAIASLERGLHVLVEKPVALTLEECDRMAAAARAAGRILMVAHNQRFRAQHQVARDVVASGRMGRVVRAHAVFAHGGPEFWSPSQTWYFEPDLAGRGVLIDLGYHKIDLLRWLLGDEVIDVVAYGVRASKPTPAEDNVATLLRFSRGTVATVHASWTQVPALGDSLSLAFERGTLDVPSNPTEPVVVRERRQNGTITTTVASDTTDGPGWSATVAAFVDAVAQGVASPVPVEDARATLACVLKAYEQLTMEPMQNEGGRHE